MKKLRLRRMVVALLSAICFGVILFNSPDLWQQVPVEAGAQDAIHRDPQVSSDTAREVLEKLPVKGRAPKTGYTRTQFGNGWASVAGCDTRNTILYRDLANTVTDENCRVVSGILHDPYTGEVIEFIRGPQSSQRVQIDHIIPLSNAWQTGAQALDEQRRIELANDPLNLLAVDGPANQQKSDGDAATWLPSNKPFRCQYIARQIAVKQKYDLWVTPPEKEAMARVLRVCPDQRLPQEAQ